MRLAFRSLAVSCLLLAPSLLHAQGKVFDSKGVPIYYLDRGNGPVVVLIHGNGGTSELWTSAGIFDSLARAYRVIAIDARGFGRSGKPHDPKQYGPEMGLDVIRLLDHLAIRRAHLVGYSMGAQIVAQLLTTHPDRILSATLGGGAGRFNMTHEDSARVELEGSEWENGVAGGPGRYATVLETWPTNEPKPSRDSIRLRGEIALANPNFDRLAQAAVVRGFLGQAITRSKAAAVTVPTLGIAGSADPRLEDLRELQRLRPSLRVVVIDRATHSGARGALRRPEFLVALRNFLDEQPRSD